MEVVWYMVICVWCCGSRFENRPDAAQRVASDRISGSDPDGGVAHRGDLLESENGVALLITGLHKEMTGLVHADRSPQGDRGGDHFQSDTNVLAVHDHLNETLANGVGVLV